MNFLSVVYIKKPLHSGNILHELFLKKDWAPLKSKNLFILRIHGLINISPDIVARLTKRSVNQMVAKKITFNTKSFSVSKINNAFCTIIGFKFEKNW